MKQGNPTRKFGIIAAIGAMLSGLMSKPEGTTNEHLQVRKNFLLTNGGAAPIPSRFLNQRQKRKLQRQTNRY
jgi:hypothetical protein